MQVVVFQLVGLPLDVLQVVVVQVVVFRIDALRTGVPCMFCLLQVVTLKVNALQVVVLTIVAMVDALSGLMSCRLFSQSYFKRRQHAKQRALFKFVV